MNTTQEKETQKEAQRLIQKGDVVSVPFGKGFLAGVVVDVDNTHIKINNYRQDDVKIPNNELVYKFFPGQRYDIREFERIDESTADKLSVRAKLDKFLSKTEVGSFENFVKNHKGDLVQLLKGELTNSLFNGSSIVTNKEGEKELKNWACKFQLYRGINGSLKLNTTWKQDIPIEEVYGVNLTADEIHKMKEKNQSVVLERTRKDGVPFKVFCKYDRDLNTFVTSQYSEKIEEKMKIAYNKKENLDKEQTKTEQVSPKKKGVGM